MQSWSLKKFVGEYGVKRAAKIMKRTRQAVEQAIKAKRDIKIVHVDGHYEAHEFRMLSRVPEHKISLRDYS